MDLKGDKYLIQIDHDTDPGTFVEKMECLLKFLNIKYEILQKEDIPSVQFLVHKNSNPL